MRLSFVVLVAAFALVATSEGVSGANPNQQQISAVVSPGVESLVSDQNDGINGRILKVDETEEEFSKPTDDEERAIIGSIPGLSGLKGAVAKLKFRSWFRSSKTPAMVNAELGLTTAKSGSINWAYAVGYAKYWRNLKYGPYAVDNVIKTGSKNK